MIRVYPATKLHHAPMLAARFAEPQYASHIFNCARWFQHHAVGTPDNKHFARRFWVEDEEDVLTADVVLVYGEADDALRGALVEAGIAMTRGTSKIIVCGTCPSFGTWQYHPRIHARVERLDDALDLIVRISLGVNARA